MVWAIGMVIKTGLSYLVADEESKKLIDDAL